MDLRKAINFLKRELRDLDRMIDFAEASVLARQEKAVEWQASSRRIPPSNHSQPMAARLGSPNPPVSGEKAVRATGTK